MDRTAPYIFFNIIVITVFLFLPGMQLFSQDTLRPGLHISVQVKDSVLLTADTSLSFSSYLLKKQQIHERINGLIRSDRKVSLRKSMQARAASAFQLYNPAQGAFADKSIFSVRGGYLSYAMNYRSIIDTPYAEKNILQHNLFGRLNFTLGGVIPLQMTYLVRQSNSAIFRDIRDVQLSFDPAGLRSMVNGQVKKQLEEYAGSLEDSFARKLLALKDQDLKLTDDWLKNPFQLQRVIEANEIIQVPGITYDLNLPKEKNMAREDSLKQKAAKFLELYKRIQAEYARLNVQVDSIRKIYAKSELRVRQFRQASRGDWNSYGAYTDWKSKMKEQDLPEVDLPKKYQWLLGIRNFSVGRTPVNYSELTAKNISVNGINLEYNSWYYVGLSAGLVDFRFRDFAIGTNHNRQYLFLARAGLGKLEKTYFILSAFKGRKQLFATSASSAGVAGINIQGYSAETKWRINRDSYLVAEVAESISPDFRNGDLRTNTKLSLSDYSNKALSLKFYSYYPKTRSRLEAAYKYTGSNYQSFSSFQTNSALKTWYIKGEQNLFGRLLKLTASARSNDFSNPYIIQNYKSNTIFKTVSATIRKRNWPVLSIAYMPMSQLSKLGEQLSENRFQALNANVYHYFKVGNTRTASTLMFNKFYNHSSDSGFVYYNATNIYWGQNIFLSSVTANVSVSDTRNSEFRTQVFDESVQMNLTKLSTLLVGVKVNNFNAQEVKVGAYVNTSIRFWQRDVLYLSFERGFLPGFSKKLIRNDMATIQFTKSFGQR